MMPKIERLEAIYGSPDDREDMIVQVFTKDSGIQVAELSAIAGELAIQWFQRGDGPPLLFNAAEVLEIIERTRNRILN